MRSDKSKMMNITRQWTLKLILLLFSAGCLLRCNPAAAKSDYVYRPQLSLSGPIADDARWTASVEPRMTSKVQQAGEIALVGGFRWKPTGYLTVTPQFKYVAKGADAHSNESRPRLAVELTGPTGPCKMAIRNRIEYRMKENQDEYYRYRARFKIKFPKLGTITPFAYEEVFYEFGDKDELNGNEAGLGASLPLGDQIGLDLDLRWCHSKSEGEWGTGDVHLLTVIKYSF